MASFRADIEYEGTRYRGWQVQANARSVAGELQRALTDAGAEIVEVGGSGRTDAGVHALRQTAHIRLRQAADPERLRRAVNDALPADIHVLALRPAHDRFHARHDAVERSYLYQVSLRRTALAKRFVWWVKHPLDVERITLASRILAGRHDFRLFCEQPGQQTSTLVVVDRVEVLRAEELVVMRFVASHFLWKMVRRLVGTLVRVGTGDLSLDELTRLLEHPEPTEVSPVAAWTAPPSGLFLERVLYPDEPPLRPLAPITPGVSEADVASATFLGSSRRRFASPR